MADPRDIARREYKKEYKVSWDINDNFDTSLIIKQWCSNIKKQVVIYGRTSTGTKKDIEELKVHLNREAENRDIDVKKDKYGRKCIYVEVKSGKLSKLYNRKEFYRAVEESENGKYPILVVTPSRLLRNENYHPCWNQSLKPTQQEWEHFIKFFNLDDTTLYCLSDPNLSIDQDEAFLNKVMVVEKPKRRGYSKSRKIKYKEYAVNLVREGYSYGKVANEVSEKSGHKISKTTIHKWVRGSVSNCSSSLSQV